MSDLPIEHQIRQKAIELGFDSLGFSKAEFLEKEAQNLEKWLERGFHGTMAYMENHFEKRTDPRLLLEGTRSIISVLHNYMPSPDWQQAPDAPKISTYAWGEDYHRVLKRKLHELVEFIRMACGEVSTRVFTDSAPVMDKVWAARSGLGWIGKNTNLIHPKKGSWFFIGEILIDIDFEYDNPIEDFCGTCTACIDECPTGALEPYQIDSTKCISYLTIELKEQIPADFQEDMSGWAYGCDICQDVCPWNRFGKPDESGDFKPLDHVLSYSVAEWAGLSKSKFSKLTRLSAMSRIKFDKWQGNLRFLDEKD